MRDQILLRGPSLARPVRQEEVVAVVVHRLVLRRGWTGSAAHSCRNPSAEQPLPQKSGPSLRPHRHGDLPELAVGVPQAGQRTLSATEVDNVDLPDCYDGVRPTSSAGGGGPGRGTDV